jgi:hypothetical protein
MAYAIYLNEEEEEDEERDKELHSDIDNLELAHLVGPHVEVSAGALEGADHCRRLELKGEERGKKTKPWPNIWRQVSIVALLETIRRVAFCLKI